MRVLCFALITAIGAHAFSSDVRAQETTPAREGVSRARLHGTIADAATGTPLDGAEVRLVGLDSVVVRTNSDGTFAGVAVRPGTYRIFVRRIGYVASNTDIEIRGNRTTRIDIALDAAPFSLETMVVTAARRPQRLADAVTTTEVISRDDINRTGSSDLASILTEHTGINLQGGHPAGAGVMLQGIGSERVLVLLDGQPIAGRISGVFDIARVPAAMVDRIEVVKGPQSTLYGTEAMGGVVNIITRTPATGVMSSNVAVTGGTQDRRDVTAGMSLSRGNVAAQWDVAHRNTATTPGRDGSHGALARRTDAAAKLRWNVDSGVMLEASLLALDERQRWRSASFFNFGDNRQYTARVSGAWQLGVHRLTPTLSASMFDHVSRESTVPKPIAGDDGERQQQRLYQAELLYNTSFGGKHLLDIGVQARRDETETERVAGGKRSIQMFEPFVQLEFELPARVSFVPGVRVSQSDLWGTHVTPRLATRWRATDALTLRASAGDGFRAPDFKELFMFFQNTSAGYAVYGNEALRPERSRNVSAGAEWAMPSGFWRANVFWNHLRDFIETRPTTPPGQPPVYQYFNVDNGYTQGVEFESGVAVSGWRFEGGYSGLHTRDANTDYPLLGRPTHSGRVLVSRTLPFALRTSVSAVATGRTPMERDTTTGVVTSWRGAYTRVDMRVARSIARHVEFSFGADNVFNQQPAIWPGFTGRHLYTTLSWTFNRNSR